MWRQNQLNDVTLRGNSNSSQCSAPKVLVFATDSLQSQPCFFYLKHDQVCLLMCPTKSRSSITLRSHESELFQGENGGKGEWEWLRGGVARVCFVGLQKVKLSVICMIWVKEGLDCNDNRNIYCNNSTLQRVRFQSETWLETITKRLDLCNDSFHNVPGRPL